MHPWLPLLTCALLVISGVWAAEDVPSKVAPDRPTVSNSTETVPVSAVQIEMGLEYARSSVADGPDERRLAAQATLRTGLTDRLEVRLEGEPLVRFQQEQDDTGIGDLDLGLKYRFFVPPEGQWWPSLGVQPFIKVPKIDRS
jgi:Putative MetA-pathway of phenol degradation